MRPIHLVTSKFLIIFTSLVLLVLNTAGSFQHWQIIDGSILPADSAQISGEFTRIAPRYLGNLDGAGDMECLSIVDETVQITDCSSSVLWQSPSGWHVTEAQIGDLNRDGVDEAILLVWRLFKPWPVDKYMPFGGRIREFHNTNGESCQVILIGWTKDGFREIWAGSALIRPLEQMKVADLNGDGWQELAALERPYDSNPPNNALTVWKWLGFGFTLIDDLEGSFNELSTITDGKQNWFVTK